MAYTIERRIVIPDKYVQNTSGYVAPFRQVHLHSTANPSASLDNEVAYLSRNYQNGNYTHLAGDNGRVIQVAEVGQGAWDVGGDWNAETYAAIEFGEKVTSQEDFNASYRAYIELARDLAKQAGIPLTLDTPDVAGIKTHNYVSSIGHGSDHVDPIAFLAKWGVSYDVLKHDIENGVGTVETPKEVENEVAKANKGELSMFIAKCVGGDVNEYVKDGTFVLFNLSRGTYSVLNGNDQVDAAAKSHQLSTGESLTKTEMNYMVIFHLIMGSKLDYRA
ncbi:N-acetylmuramoyl-L-alanine amidase [Lactococcus laudensis]|uniref:N-acetylmuramoyl-L-alanine amidase n=1 Tax=Pseudolactococcus laudensis TaxID=1494461 RepID=A0A7V8SKB1_9LACT|nr:peptidoglycan recognition family protein [Lactococcus laudensis]MBA0017203.1 N-acetylmuramoyl-L-alanine amidase [Lactococcus laudensis]MBW9281865.1 N-acetylmuramoyl-L-alanine amidase [Lactococcus laudensis]